jgi:hypothetical protein
MLDPFYILAVILMIGIFYVIPILLIYFVFKLLLKKKLNRKIVYSILTLMIITFLFTIYSDFYPLENSYSRNFKEKTDLNFPKSAKYIEKISANSIFDFGGRMYCSKIKTNNNDYLKLKREIENSKFTKVDYYTEDFDAERIFSRLKKSDIEQIYCLRTSFDEYFVILLSEKKTLIFFYRSW